MTYQDDSYLRFPPAATQDALEHSRAPFLRKSGFLIGSFLPNVSWGFTSSKQPSETSFSYPYNRRVAQIADRNGLDFVFPVARWRGMGGPIDYWGASLEAFTLAAALSEATDRIGVLSTVQASLTHPLMAAKMGATIDQISGGRWGLNLVAGWNVEESRMFGSPLIEHDARYDQAREWVTIVKELWSEGHVDFRGEYFQVEDAVSWPRPRQAPLPPIVNAAASSAGRALALQECDLLFINGGSRESVRDQVDAIKSQAREMNLPPVRVCLVVYGLIHPNRSMVEDLGSAIVHEADWETIANKVGGIKRGGSEVAERTGQRAQVERTLEERGLAGVTGLYTITGTADDFAEEVKALATECGVDGIVLSFFNWATMMEYFCQEALPLLAQERLWSPAP